MKYRFVYRGTRLVIRLGSLPGPLYEIMIQRRLALFSTGRLFLALEGSFPQISERAPTLIEITVGFIYPREGVKTMAKKKHLISGEKLNCRYPRCVEIWAHPPVTSYVDIENQFLSL